ncbi:hypothetical protein [Streptomyces sp. Isolate_45]|uniref:hypothetical protein n=1 Tax=Streptomyces sp. Isolate_45 TaxID=2950111 RepID=UPI002481AFB5|nr:hypothetical protein [Streptomyces sp. Isolate_45]MDA5279589.1 hypothetical protein [Streptomyces sp. Isolate_45]
MGQGNRAGGCDQVGEFRVIALGGFQQSGFRTRSANAVISGQAAAIFSKGRFLRAQVVGSVSKRRLT